MLDEEKDKLQHQAPQKYEMSISDTAKPALTVMKDVQ